MFLLDGQALGALLSAAAAHELGHLAALAAVGFPVSGVWLTATGPVIRCDVPRGGAADVFVSLAGPVFGLALWLTLRRCWPLAAEMSAVLTAVNLLPVLPLDGGRALRALLGGGKRAARVMAALRVVLCLCLTALGALCLLRGLGGAPLLLAFWLLLLPKTCKTAPDDVQYSY